MNAFVLTSPCFFGSRVRTTTPKCSSRIGVSLSMSADRSVVWIRRGDLRTIDHPGLLAVADAAAAAAVVTSNVDSNVLLALESSLRRKQGIPLSLIADDSEASAVASFVKFAKKFQATTVHVRLDESEESRSVVNELANLLPNDVVVNTWQDEYRTWDDETLQDIPDEYPKFKSWRNSKNAPIRPIDTDIARNRFFSDDTASNLSFPPSTAQIGDGEQDAYARFVDRYNADSVRSNTVTVSVNSEDSVVEDVDEFGEYILRRYLESCDEKNHSDLARSLAPIFSYGLLSSRRIREIVELYERENGRLWRVIYRDGAKQVLDYLDAREFAQLLARRDLSTNATVDGVHQARFWRWNGYLVRYVMEGPMDTIDPSLPTLLLVHGFGASVQHWRRSLSLKKKEFNVFALDLVGYGRSEKPPAAYTQELWGMVLFDFVKEVVRRPVYIAGNSIGGYFSAAFASDAYPDLCAGLILVNSAGKLEDRTLPDEPKAMQKKQDSRSFSPLAPIFSVGKIVLENYKPARMLAANILLNNLRGRIQKTLQMVYPTNPECADEELAAEIYRNSLDYGADSVLASGLVLPPPRTLSELLQKYQGRLLVYQGVLDPLNSSSDRAEKMRREYPEGTAVAKRQLGHCPHEEDAENFAMTVSQWIKEQERLEKKERNVESAVEDSSSAEVAIQV